MNTKPICANCGLPLLSPSILDQLPASQAWLGKAVLIPRLLMGKKHPVLLGKLSDENVFSFVYGKTSQPATISPHKGYRGFGFDTATFYHEACWELGGQDVESYIYENLSDAWTLDALKRAFPQGAEEVDVRLIKEQQSLLKYMMMHPDFEDKHLLLHNLVGTLSQLTAGEVCYG